MQIPRPAFPWVRPEALLFTVLVLLHLVPLWAFPYFPSQDGPGHQAVAHILREYDQPGEGLLREYYLLNRGFIPNWFIFFLLEKGLAFVTVPVAEKVLLSLYVILLPVSARFALRAVDPRGSPLAFLAFPFVYNHLFHLGFYNFCFSLAVFFFTVGFWWKRQDRWGPGPVAGLALLLLWAYFCHPVSLGMTLVAIFTLAGWRMLLEMRGKAGPFVVGDGLRTWIVGPFFASLPALLLLSFFLDHHLGRPVQDLPFVVKAWHLVSLNSLVSLDRRSLFVSISLAALLGLAAMWLLARRRRAACEDGLLLAAVVSAVLFLVVPDGMGGGGRVSERLGLYPFFLLILWFVACKIPPAGRRWLAIGGAAVSLVLLALFWPRYAALDDQLDEYMTAADHIEPGHTLLTLCYAPKGRGADGRDLAYRFKPFLHAQGRIAAKRGAVDLALYEASEDYFPIYFRPSLNPYERIGIAGGLELEPPQAEFLTYPERTGGRVDYVLLWGLGDEDRGEPAVRSVLREVAAGYEPVYTSPRELVRLYRRREASASPTAR
ncbi:MAG TPA: hypothetical protein VJ725_00095 [Thermoanaerobaculia bacterium]|nr:hypothetical protein [Thermoanaerobaculia bacterium]